MRYVHNDFTGFVRTLRSDTLGTMRRVVPAMDGSMAMAMLASPAQRKFICSTGDSVLRYIVKWETNLWIGHGL